MPPDATSLMAVENAIFSMITGLGDEVGPPAPARYIVSDRRASADERLQVYARMVRSRLVEALEGQFPNLARKFGHDAFTSLALSYLAEYPSRNPSLGFLGHALPAWLARQARLGDEGRVLSDLARLEWARHEVFDERDQAVLDVATLRELPASAFAELPLRLVTASRLVVVAAAVPALWSALEGSGDEAHAFGSESLDPRTVLVWRQGVSVFHRTLADAEAGALERIASGGAGFGAICESLASALPAEEATARAFAWLSTWAGDELLVAPAA